MLCVEGIVFVVAILGAEHWEVLVAYHNGAATLGGVHHTVILIQYASILAGLVE